MAALALIALVVLLPSVASAAPATTSPQTAAAPAHASGKATTPQDPNESLPIPEGSSGPASISGGAGSTLVRLVVGLIALVWYLLKRVQRSRYPAMDDRNPAGLIDVLATTALGPNRSLHLVKVGEEIVLVGSTDHSVAPIARIGAEDAASLVGATAPEPKSFSGDPGAAARTRATTVAADASVVERLRAMTARK
jgi:flagellar biogenesis protein FliO